MSTSFTKVTTSLMDGQQWTAGSMMWTDGAMDALWSCDWRENVVHCRKSIQPACTHFILGTSEPNKVSAKALVVSGVAGAL